MVQKRQIEASRAHRFGFPLLDNFALMSFACAIEPLRAANFLSGRKLYEWLYVSNGAKVATASSGLQVRVDHTISDAVRFDTILVCAGGNPTLYDDRKTIAWLRRQARAGCSIGGISGGPYILAKAGLLDHARCTIHWEHFPAFVEAFPDIEVTRNLFELDAKRVTCGGGIAALDMMHAIIRRDHGQAFASQVSDWFLQTSVRMGTAGQRISLRERIGSSNRSLLSAIEAMERHIAQPKDRASLAKLAGVSVRQLERLFARHLGTTMNHHYLSLRLAKAQVLLRQTSLPVVQIASECGFSDASHFAKAYRRAFGISPSGDRIASH